MSAARRFFTLLKTELGLALGLYAFSIFGFIRSSSGQGADYADIAIGEFLWTIISYQLRVLPAYALVAFVCTVLLFPVLHRRAVLEDRGRWRRLKRYAVVGGASVALYFFSLGPFFAQSPGLLDGTARLMSVVAPDTDLYVLYRWHILDAARVAFFGVVAFAVFSYGRWALTRLKRSGALPRIAAAVAVLSVTGIAMAALHTPAPPPLTAETPMNVLIIASDSLRYDHLGTHGYHRQDISPNIDAFAADAADLRNLHVGTASTLESWMSIMTSQLPPNHGVRYMYLRKDQAEKASAIPYTLPRVLNNMGYHTTVVSNWAGNCFKLVDVGFSENHASDTQNFKSLIMESTIWTHLVFPLYFSNGIGEWMLPEVTRITKYLRPSALIDKMKAQLDLATAAEKPFFGLLFFSSTHLPYTASYPFNVKYTEPGYDGPHRYQIDVSVHELITTGFDPDMPPETIQHIRNLYDGTVSEFDSYVGEVIADLKARGLYDRTIIIITTDHGEDLYDKGSTLGHGTNFFGGDQSTHIPFIIRVPGVTKPGQKVDLMARSIDLAPTLMSLLGGQAPEAWHGVDLSPALRGEIDDLDLPVFAETCYLFFPKSKAMLDLSDAERDRVLDSSSAKDTLEIDHDFNNNMVLRRDLHEQVLGTKDRMVRTRRWKLLHIPGKGAPIYRLWDMQADPHQQRDLSGDGIAVMPYLIDMLDAYWAGEGGAQRWPAEWEDPAYLEANPQGARAKAL